MILLIFDQKYFADKRNSVRLLSARDGQHLIINIMDTKTNEANNVQNIVERTESREQIISKMIKESNSHYVVKTTALHFHAVKNKTKDGLGNYISVGTLLQDAVKRFKEAEDGNIILQLSNFVQFSQYDIINIMQKDMYYNILAARTAQNFELDADMNTDPRDASNVYFTDDYLRGIPVKVFCQFVDSGEIAKNPFSYSTEPYEVKNAPRYIYHLIGIGQPTDAECIENILQQKAEIKAENLAKRKALLDSRRQIAKVIASIETPRNEVPF